MRVNGLEVVVSGQGRRVAFVHGVGADMQSWDGVIAALGDGFECLRYDLRGHGASDKTPGPYSLEMFRDDLAGITVAAGWREFDLVGFSLGGLIVQAYALKAPATLRTLAVLSGIAGRTPEEAQRAASRADALLSGGGGGHADAAVERWFTDRFRREHPEVVQARVARSRQNDPACYAAAYRVLATSDLAADLHRITPPTLIATGEGDQGSTPRMSRLMGERIAGSEVEIWTELRHSVLLEAPERVAASLRRLFEAHPVAG